MQEIKIFTDGGSRGNPGPAAAGIVIEDAGKPREICGKYLGIATNNVAEYTAVLISFQLLNKRNLVKTQTSLQFYTDSQLVANQLSGNFRIKNQNLKLIYLEIKKEEKDYASVKYQFIPREQNKLADLQVNLALDKVLK